MFLSRECSVIPAGTPFIPLYRNVRYIKWIGKPGEGRIDYMTQDKNDSRIKAEQGLTFRKDNNSGETIAPSVTTYINFYVMIRGTEFPAILSFKRTGIPDGKRLTQDILLATQGSSLPMFALTFILNTPKVVKDGNLHWHLYSIRAAGYTDQSMLDRAEKMAELAKNLSNMATEAEFESAENDSSGAPKRTSGTIIDTTPTSITVNAPTSAPINTAVIPPAAQATPVAPAAPVAPPVITQAPLITPPAGATAIPQQMLQGEIVKAW